MNSTSKIYVFSLLQNYYQIHFGIGFSITFLFHLYYAVQMTKKFDIKFTIHDKPFLLEVTFELLTKAFMLGQELPELNCLGQAKYRP